MKVISRNSEIEINGQVMKVEDVLTVLKDLPSQEIVAFFNEQGMNMPRKVRMTALHKVLDKRVKKEEFQKQFTDEVRYRVRWIKTFSEHQLEGTLALISNADIYNEYRETLWLMFIKLHEELKIDDAALAKLYETARGYKQSTKESITEYQRGMDSLFYDERNEVDGLEYNTFREVLSKSSTLNELREIGAKYNIDVPRRIKKEELVDIIIDACSASGKFTKEEEDKVKRMSVQQLQRYAKQNGVKASIELKKEDIIEYIITRVETEVQKSYVNLAVLDIPTEDDEPEEEEIIEETPIIEEAEEAPQSNAQIDELKAMILNLQQQMLNKDKSQEEKEELAKQAEEAQAKADAAEEALKAQQEAHEQQLAEVQAQHEEEKAQAVDEALAQAEAEAEAQRLAEEQAQKEAEEAKAQQEAEEAKQAEMDALKEENETLKEQMASMQESKDLEEDEFVIPLFEYEEAKEEEPAEEETVEETPAEETEEVEQVEEIEEVEEAETEEAEEEVVEEAPAEEEVEEGVITLEDTENEEFTMFEETEQAEDDEDAIKMEEFEDVAMPDIEDTPSESYQTADKPTETTVEEAPAKEETTFDSPSYDDSDEYGSFDTPLFDTPIFEAPVFEAPIYGEDKAARERRLGNETRVDKKKKAAEEKAIKEALSADSKVARRKKKSNPIVTILKWLLIIIVILLILLIILGILGVLGVLDGTPLQDLYLNVCKVIKTMLGNDLYESVTKTIKGWFGK